MTIDEAIKKTIEMIVEAKVAIDWSNESRLKMLGMLLNHHIELEKIRRNNDK